MRHNFHACSSLNAYVYIQEIFHHIMHMYIYNVMYCRHLQVCMQMLYLGSYLLFLRRSNTMMMSIATKTTTAKAQMIAIDRDAVATLLSCSVSPSLLL